MNTNTILGITIVSIEALTGFMEANPQFGKMPDQAALRMVTECIFGEESFFTAAEASNPMIVSGAPESSGYRWVLVKEFMELLDKADQDLLRGQQDLPAADARRIAASCRTVAMKYLEQFSDDPEVRVAAEAFYNNVPVLPAYIKVVTA